MSNLNLWSRDPFFAEFDTLVRQTFGPGSARTNQRNAFTPAAELAKDGEDAVVRLELPGLDPAKDVSVEVQRGQLLITGERRDERSGEEAGRSFTEIRYGSFRRAFALPGHVGPDAVQASYDSGVLTVRVLGAYAGSTPSRIDITSNATSTVHVGEATPAKQVDSAG